MQQPVALLVASWIKDAGVWGPRTKSQTTCSWCMP